MALGESSPLLLLEWGIEYGTGLSEHRGAQFPWVANQLIKVITWRDQVLIACPKCNDIDSVS